VDDLPSDEMPAEIPADDGASAVVAPVLKPWQVTLLVGPIIALVIANYLGNASAPKLVNENPELLIALSALNRNLILVVNQISPVAYYTIGFVRLLLPDVFFFLLGWYYSDRAIIWMERRTANVGRYMRQLEGLFGRYGYVLVLIIPNNPVCLLAGAARMRPRTFWALNIIGTIGRLVLLAWLGDIFSGPIDAVLGFIRRYQPYLLAISIASVAFTVWRESRTGSTEIQQLLELEDELEQPAPRRSPPTEVVNDDDDRP
jgi:membrane protein DedA with SNARE-associated domain